MRAATHNVAIVGLESTTLSPGTPISSIFSLALANLQELHFAISVLLCFVQAAYFTLLGPFHFATEPDARRRLYVFYLNNHPTRKITK